MNSFEQCRAIESESLPKVLKTLNTIYDCIIPTDDFKYHLTYQQYYGDYACIKKNILEYVEVKTETNNKWGNFYLETWSNKPENRGWFYKCLADYILYHFLEDNVIYMFDLKKAQEYINNNPDKYNEKPQNKYNQKNKTYGLCVPVSDIMKHAGYLTFQLGEDNE